VGAGERGGREGCNPGGEGSADAVGALAGVLVKWRMRPWARHRRLCLTAGVADVNVADPVMKTSPAVPTCPSKW